jgi:transposase
MSTARRAPAKAAAALRAPPDDSGRSASAVGTALHGPKPTFIRPVEQFLVPTLSAGDIVIMDNLGSDKGQAVRQLIRSAGAKLFFLPRYSPDLNPIEQVFAKLKTLLRKTETTWHGIGTILDRFKPEECANYLVNAGYASA